MYFNVLQSFLIQLLLFHGGQNKDPNFIYIIIHLTLLPHNIFVSRPFFIEKS